MKTADSVLNARGRLTVPWLIVPPAAALLVFFLMPLLVVLASLAGFATLGCGWAGLHAGRIAASQLVRIAPFQKLVQKFLVDCSFVRHVSLSPLSHYGPPHKIPDSPHSVRDHC